MDESATLDSDAQRFLRTSEGERYVARLRQTLANLAARDSALYQRIDADLQHSMERAGGNQPQALVAAGARLLASPEFAEHARRRAGGWGPDWSAMRMLNP